MKEFSFVVGDLAAVICNHPGSSSRIVLAAAIGRFFEEEDDLAKSSGDLKVFLEGVWKSSQTLESDP